MPTMKSTAPSTWILANLRAIIENYVLFGGFLCFLSTIPFLSCVLLCKLITTYLLTSPELAWFGSWWTALALTPGLLYLVDTRFQRANASVPQTGTKGKPHVVVIGAGFGSFILGYKLRKMGVSFLIVEKGNRVGGTWADNQYPGSGCDIPSMLYQPSFAMKTDWSRKWAPQSEIQSYIQHLYTKFDVLRSVQFHTEVTNAKWNDKTKEWTITTVGTGTGQQEKKRQDEIVCNVFVSAVGQLSYPMTPSIPGIDDFKGDLFHSARWPDASQGGDLTGRRVAIIGAAASAVQIIPAIAGKVKQLFVFQRTPSYITPKFDHTYGKIKSFLFTHVPLAARLYRWHIFILAEGVFKLVITKSSWGNRVVAPALFGRQLTMQVKDKTLLKKLTPTYTPMCKRVLFSSEYYPTLCRDNVELITESPAKITDKAVVTKDGKSFETDVVVFATGFKSTAFLYPMTITGQNGVILADVWKRAAYAYKGITVPSFPNMYIMYGPNTNLGHNSIIFMLECQANYIAQAIAVMTNTGAASLEVTESASDAYQRQVKDALDTMAFTAECNSWYRTADGLVPNNNPWTCAGYWWRTLKFDVSAYEFAGGRKNKDE